MAPSEDELMLKQCVKCLNSKPFDEFQKNIGGKYDLRGSCKSCDKPKRQTYYQNHKKDYKERTRKWAKNNREKRKDLKMKYRYRVSETEYSDLFKLQNGVCKICKEFKLPKNKTRLVLDHCHTTGKVRGLLCDKCNKALGFFEDKINLLDEAIKYLNESRRSDK